MLEALATDPPKPAGTPAGRASQAIGDLFALLLGEAVATAPAARPAVPADSSQAALAGASGAVRPASQDQSQRQPGFAEENPGPDDLPALPAGRIVEAAVPSAPGAGSPAAGQDASAPAQGPGTGAIAQQSTGQSGAAAQQAEAAQGLQEHASGPAAGPSPGAPSQAVPPTQESTGQLPGDPARPASALPGDPAPTEPASAGVAPNTATGEIGTPGQGPDAATAPEAMRKEAPSPSEQASALAAGRQPADRGPAREQTAAAKPPVSPRIGQPTGEAAQSDGGSEPAGPNRPAPVPSPATDEAVRQPSAPTAAPPRSAAERQASTERTATANEQLAGKQAGRTNERQEAAQRAAALAERLAGSTAAERSFQAYLQRAAGGEVQSATATVADEGMSHLLPSQQNAANAADAPLSANAAKPHAAPPGAQVAVQLHLAMASRLQRFSIRLEPAELGRVDVQLDFRRDGRVHALIAAERPETLDLLQKDVQSLERTLRDAGADGEKLSLSFDLQGGERQGGRGGREPAGTAEGHAEADHMTGSDDDEAGQDRPRRRIHGLLDIAV